MVPPIAILNGEKLIYSSVQDFLNPNGALAITVEQCTDNTYQNCFNFPGVPNDKANTSLDWAKTEVEKRLDNPTYAYGYIRRTANGVKYIAGVRLIVTGGTKK